MSDNKDKDMKPDPNPNADNNFPTICTPEEDAEYQREKRRTSGFTELPRVDLREHAFRRFERWIARATKESYTINSKIEFNMNPHTFCTRFRDAMRGYYLFKYDSVLIPPGYDLNLIKCKEGMDNLVMVCNPRADKAKGSSVMEVSYDNPQAIVNTMRDIRDHKLDPSLMPVMVKFNNPTQRDQILAVVNTELATMPPDKYDCAVSNRDGAIQLYTFY